VKDAAKQASNAALLRKVIGYATDRLLHFRGCGSSFFRRIMLGGHLLSFFFLSFFFLDINGRTLLSSPARVISLASVS
jgi:hypothetical protein